MPLRHCENNSLGTMSFCCAVLNADKSENRTVSPCHGVTGALRPTVTGGLVAADGKKRRDPVNLCLVDQSPEWDSDIGVDSDGHEYRRSEWNRPMTDADIDKLCRVPARPAPKGRIPRRTFRTRVGEIVGAEQKARSEIARQQARAAQSFFQHLETHWKKLKMPRLPVPGIERVPGHADEPQAFQKDISSNLS